MTCSNMLQKDYMFCILKHGAAIAHVWQCCHGPSTRSINFRLCWYPTNCCFYRTCEIDAYDLFSDRDTILWKTRS